MTASRRPQESATDPAYSPAPRAGAAGPLRVLVACEFSGTVRDAFLARGHDAVSCDLLPTESPGPHIQGDAIEAMQSRRWDMLIAHPPCTFLTVAANKWMKPEFRSRFPTRPEDREKAIEFFMVFMDAPIPRICVENPIGIMSSRYRQPDQVVQPWMFGHGETKATCFWLKGLRCLTPTHLPHDLFAEPEPQEREQRLHHLPPSPDRWKLRSATFSGIARAMAEQWG